ncbi:MAG: hypothetical protein AAF541_00245 [Pseudomonadota bacterium]
MPEQNPHAKDNSDKLDLELEQLFSRAAPDAKPAFSRAFTTKVMQQVDRSYRRAVMWRIALGLIALVIAIPLQDLGLAVTQLLVIEVVEVPNHLMSDLLTPVNSVGAVVTLCLLGIRLTQKRLFNRLAAS